MPAPFYSDAEKQVVIGLIENTLGLTPDRARQFYAESKAEAAPTSPGGGDHETDFIGDATGKFKHWLRVEKHWEGVADAVWPFIEADVRKLVEASVTE